MIERLRHRGSVRRTVDLASVLLMLLAVAAILTTVAALRGNDVARTRVGNVQDAQGDVEELRLAVADQQSAVRNYVQTGQDTFRIADETAMRHEREALGRLERFARSERSVAGPLQDARVAISQWRDASGAPGSSDNPDTLADAALGERARERIGEVRSELNDLAQSAQDQVANDLVVVAFGACVLGAVLVISAIAFFVAARRGARRLEEVADAARRVQQGDLTVHVPTFDGPRELATLAAATEGMRSSLVRGIARAEAAEAEERASNRRLEASNRDLEAFSYSVSHDLRAPLRSIEGFGNAVLEDAGHALDETSRHYLQRVCDNARNMSVLIDELLRLSSVTRQDLQRTTVDLGVLAHDALSQLRTVEPHRAVEEDVTVPLLANGDPTLLAIVMFNLVGNAWKFTGKTRSARIEVGRDDSNGVSRYFVRDNGAGFDMRYADKLFGAFQRLHRQEDFEGTGIGLATVARIVHRHGGEIEARAEPGLGATFEFTLGA